jgi:hypothetical protein
MDEFEDRLHRRLSDTAGAPGGAPEIGEIERRARRQRWASSTLGGGFAVAVLAFVVVMTTVLPLERDTSIQLDPSDPGVADQPGGESSADAEDPGPGGTADADDRDEPEDPADEGEQTADGSADAPAGPCGARERLAMVVATTADRLEAVCADGDVDVLADDVAVRNPAMAPDASGVVYEVADDDGSTLVWMDLETGESTDLGEGRLPAFAQDGTLAWISGDPASPSLVVGRPGQEPTSEQFLGTMVVLDVAWDPDDRHVHLVENSPGGAGLLVFDGYDADTSPRAPAAPDDRDGSRFLAVATSEESGLVGFVLRVGVGDGLEFVTAQDVPSSDTVQPRDRIDLDDLDLDGDPADPSTQGGLWAADGRGLRSGDGGLSRAPSDAGRSSWLVGDGETVWLVPSNGSVSAVHEQARGAAVNPAMVRD